MSPEENRELAKDLAALTFGKAEPLAGYDVLGMDRVAAICNFGRSGSYLLASYLDWHEEVLMLPPMVSRMIYPFFEQHALLSLREKLLAFPDFAAAHDNPLFSGEFAISEIEYQSAGAALLAAYRDAPADFLNSRRGFFVCLHVAYSLALGRRPGIPRPLMVYSYHYADPAIAEYIAADFPTVRFIHTVRDPISMMDSHFGFQLQNQLLSTLDGPAPYAAYFDPARWVFMNVIGADQPHPGMATCTGGVRFEDLHMDLAGTMARLAGFLELSSSPSLLRSTFNGIDWVVGKGPGAWSGPRGLWRSYYQQKSGNDTPAWSGARSEQVHRHWRNLFPWDRAVLYALFYEDFRCWGYPCPSVFGSTWARHGITVLLWLLPMKMELVGLATAIRKQIWPALRDGKAMAILRVLARQASGRLSLRKRITVEIRRRLARKTMILSLL